MPKNISYRIKLKYIILIKKLYFHSLAHTLAFLSKKKQLLKRILFSMTNFNDLKFQNEYQQFQQLSKL